MGKLNDEVELEEDDDALSEQLDELDELDDANEEALGVDDTDALDLAEIEDAPEEVGLDVETFASSDETLSALEEVAGEEGESALDDATFDIDSGLDDEDDDEQGWTEESEGTSEGFDDDELDDDVPEDSDDGGLEGVDDPLVDGIGDDDERVTVVIGDDEDDELGDEPLDRLELDLG